MVKGIRAELKGVQKALKGIERYDKAVQEAVDEELTAGVVEIEADAKGRAPVNDGLLRNSIHADTNAFLAKEVGVGVGYAGFVEFGTRLKVSIPAGLEQVAAEVKRSAKNEGDAKAAIFNWCKQKGIPEEAWYPIYRQIMTEGINAHPFFFPAYFANEQKIINNTKKAIKSIK